MFNKKNNNFFTIFIFLLTGFLLGIIFSFYYNKNSDSKLLKNKIYLDKIKIHDNINKDKQLDLDKYFQVYKKIKDFYYDFDEITEKKLIDGTISGLVSGLGDKHSEYLNKEDNSNFSEFLNQEFEGIGAIVSKDPLGIKLDRIFKGSPAELSGLLSGDIIVSADSTKLAGMKQEKAISHIKGPAGTKVILEVLRLGEESLLKKEVIRKKIEIPAVEVEILDGNIGYIVLATFGEKTADQMKKALEEVKDTDGLIIDLRNNGGGYLEIAVEILSNFIENKKDLVITKRKGSKVGQILQSNNSGNIYNGKIVVLINESSASASEITAGALRDYDKAILVGKKSYGKGSVQEPFVFSDGSMVKITVAKWFTPKDKNIDGEGIKPDIEVDFKEEDYKNKYDRQKDEAIKVLKSFIEIGALKLTVDKYIDNSKEEE